MIGTVSSADDAGVFEPLPRLLDLDQPGHVGHRAAGRQVGQDHLLVVAGEDVGRLGHEVDAAEDDELGLGPGRCLAGELERVAGDVGELDDLVALVVVAEHERALAERGAGALGAFDQIRVARRRQVAGAFDAALALRVGSSAQQEQRQRLRGHTTIVRRRLAYACIARRYRGQPNHREGRYGVGGRRCRRARKPPV